MQDLSTRMARLDVCVSPGCSGRVEASLDGGSFCRNHFYDKALKRLDEYRARVRQNDPAAADRAAMGKTLSNIISETTTLVATAKFLGPWQRDQFLELSLSAAELYKRVQRDYRVARHMPILIYRETNSDTGRELTNTINVSERGACIATTGQWKLGEKIWIERPHSLQRTLACIAWVKEIAPSQYHLGLQLLNNENFWGVKQTSLMRKNS